MTRKSKRRGTGNQIVRTAITAVMGMGLMLLVMALGACFILRGTVGERGINALTMLSVFLGSMLSSALSRGNVAGVVPHILLAAGYFLFLLFLASLLTANEVTFTAINWKTTAAVMAGSIAGVVTNLVKSNKSYINKSKWKH